MKKVSVIVPIYNVEKYVYKCIKSICSQSYRNLEILLVNDGSTDNSGDLCVEASEKDKRIKVIHKKNGGLSSARNTGLDVATGEYIAFVDADDSIHSKFVEILVGLCEEYECDIAQCNFLPISENSLLLPLNQQSSVLFYNNIQALHQLCCGNNAAPYVVTWNKIYKSRLFSQIRYPIGRIHEDEFITYQIFWKIKKMAVTSQYMYYYLQRSSSIMGNPFSIKRLDILDAFRERIQFLKRKGLEKEYQGTLKTFYYLLDKNYRLLKEDFVGHEDLCLKLSKEKEETANLIHKDPEKTESILGPFEQAEKKCAYPEDSRIVLYGAGNWGRFYYQYINETGCGKIVGWVDNMWHRVENPEYHVMPLDFLLQINYDYILIAIENKEVQREVINNLICWKIPEKKILSI